MIAAFCCTSVGCLHSVGFGLYRSGATALLWAGCFATQRNSGSNGLRKSGGGLYRLFWGSPDLLTLASAVSFCHCAWEMAAG